MKMCFYKKKKNETYPLTTKLDHAMGEKKTVKENIKEE